MIKVTAPAGRPAHLRSTGGAAVHLAPGASRVVQPMFGVEAAQNGCTIEPVDGSSMADVPVSPTDQVDADTGRLAELTRVVRDMVREGVPADFTNAGRPRKPAVQTRTDVIFSSAELGAVFERVIADEE